MRDTLNRFASEAFEAHQRFTRMARRTRKDTLTEMLAVDRRSLCRTIPLCMSRIRQSAASRARTRVLDEIIVPGGDDAYRGVGRGAGVGRSLASGTTLAISTLV